MFDFLENKVLIVVAILFVALVIFSKWVFDKNVELRSELKKERERLNNIIEGTNAGTWESNVKTKELRVDKKCAEMLGYSLEELNPEKLALWKILIHPEDSELTTKTIKKHLSGETEYYEHEYRLKHKNGDYIWILSRGKVLSWDKMQNPLFMFGTNMDITKRKVVEEKIKEWRGNLNDKPWDSMSEFEKNEVNGKMHITLSNGIYRALINGSSTQTFNYDVF